MKVQFSTNNSSAFGSRYDFKTGAFEGDLSQCSASGATFLFPPEPETVACTVSVQLCRAAMIMRACFPVIGLINRLIDDSRLSHPATVREGGKKRRGSGNTGEG